MTWRRQGLAWALLLLLFGLRFVALAKDPVLVSPSGMYLTDEGWYSKAAKNLIMLGHADASQDFVPITHTFGFVSLCRLLFEQFGLSLVVLRGFNLMISGVGLVFLCLSVQRQWGRRYAYLLGLALIANLLLISLTRMALPDTTAFALLTLAMASVISAKGRWSLELTGLGLAIAMSFVKTSYLPVTLWFAFLFAIHPAQLRHRPRPWWRRGLFPALALAGLGLGYAEIYRRYPEAWAMFSQLNLQGRMVQDPLRWVMNLAYAVGADLWSTGVLGLGLFTLVEIRQLGFKAWFKDPKVRALLLLLGLNFSARSLIWYHPPRYGLITALGIILLSLSALEAATARSPQRGPKLRRHWLGWGLLGQLPLGLALAQNGFPGDSLHRATKNVIQKIHAHPHQPKILYGSGTASAVSLSFPKLRAVDISDHPQDMCTRIERYGDGFLLVDDRKQEQFKLLATLDQCPDNITLRPLLQTTVLNNYYRQGPWRLYTLSRTRTPTKQ